MSGFRSKSKADMRKQVMNYREVAPARADSGKATKGVVVRPGQTRPPAVQASGYCPYAQKDRYNSKAEALSGARHREAAENGPDRLRVYKCPVCDGWHLTSRFGGRAD